MRERGKERNGFIYIERETERDIETARQRDRQRDRQAEAKGAWSHAITHD